MSQLPQDPAATPNWRAAVVDLITARINLFQLEVHAFAEKKIRNLLLLGICLGTIFFAWIFLLIGVIPVFAALLKVPWHYVVLGYAAIHLLVALLCLVLRRPSSSNPFAHTREELKRDREWIAKL